MSEEEQHGVDKEEVEDINTDTHQLNNLESHDQNEENDLDLVAFDDASFRFRCG